MPNTIIAHSSGTVFSIAFFRDSAGVCVWFN